MKRLNLLPEREFLKWFFLFFSSSFLVAALFMPDRADMLPGLWRILNSPTRAATNFFSVGGYAASFLNMGLVGLICTGLYWIPGEKAAAASTLVTILTISFGSWGIHIVNMWPGILGVALHCLVKKEKLGDNTTAMLFSTGLAPFISELLVRYPRPRAVGLHFQGILMALAVGLLVGYFLPAGLKNSPKIHKGFTLYSAALPVGMTAFLLQGFLYRGMGTPIPEVVGDLSVASREIVTIFCVAVFATCIVVAHSMGCRYWDYWRLVTHPKLVSNFTSTYGNCVMLMNVGVYGLFILGYYHLVGAEFNGVTFGCIIGMLCTCNSGAHPGNILFIMLGYALAEMGFQYLSPLFGGEFSQFLNTQSIVVGLCFATGLAPIVDEYGIFYGMLGAALHFCMVTTVPQLHGGLCLYNGGFTAALVCLLYLPLLDNSRFKYQRRADRVRKFRNRFWK